MNPCRCGHTVRASWNGIADTTAVILINRNKLDAGDPDPIIVRTSDMHDTATNRADIITDGRVVASVIYEAAGGGPRVWIETTEQVRTSH